MRTIPVTHLNRIVYLTVMTHLPTDMQMRQPINPSDDCNSYTDCNMIYMLIGLYTDATLNPKGFSQRERERVLQMTEHWIRWFSEFPHHQIISDCETWNQLSLKDKFSGKAHDFKRFNIQKNVHKYIVTLKPSELHFRAS